MLRENDATLMLASLQLSGMRQFYVYILASRSRRLYVGVTNNLATRMFEHREGRSKFTARYRINRLVHFETCNNSITAIAREKQIKAWRREKRVALIAGTNPTWDDLAANWFVIEAPDGRSVEKDGEKADPSLRSG